MFCWSIDEAAVQINAYYTSYSSLFKVRNKFFNIHTLGHCYSQWIARDYKQALDQNKLLFGDPFGFPHRNHGKYLGTTC